jgi:hypothetical protein
MFKAIAMGIVGVAMVTALFLPGRETVAFTQAAGTSGSKILGTAIRG